MCKNKWIVLTANIFILICVYMNTYTYTRWESVESQEYDPLSLAQASKRRQAFYGHTAVNISTD